MPSKATTVAEYLSELPEDRRAALEAVRKVFRANLDKRFVEGMAYGMIGWAVPHSLYPAGYHCNPAQPLPFAGLASQKSGMSLHLIGLYYDQQGGKPGPLLEWFTSAWKKSGKKLDMGKACIRFKKVDDLALDVLAEALRKLTYEKFIAMYEGALSERKPSKAHVPKKRPSAKVAARKPRVK
jgi:hypothetical protein